MTRLSHLTSDQHAAARVVLEPVPSLWAALDEDEDEPLFAQPVGLADAEAIAALQDLSARLQRLMHVSGVAVAVRRAESFMCVAASGAAAPDFGTVLDPTRGLSAECIRTRESRVCADTETDTRVNRDACRYGGSRSIAVLPLHSRDTVVGVLAVFSTQRAFFTEAHLFFLEVVAAFITHASEPDYKSKTDKPKAKSIDVFRTEPTALKNQTVSPKERVGPAAPGWAGEQRSPDSSDTANTSDEDTEWGQPYELSSYEFPDEPCDRKHISLPILALCSAVLVLAAGIFFFVRGRFRSTPPSASIVTEKAVVQVPSLSPTPPAQVESQPSLSVPQVALGMGATVQESVQFVSGSGYARAIIRLNGEGEHDVQCGRLTKPERLYCDLDEVKVPHSFVDEQVMGVGLITGLRVGQFRPEIARVVLDLKEDLKAPSLRHAATVLSNPPRLMIEVMELPALGVDPRMQDPRTQSDDGAGPPAAQSPAEDDPEAGNPAARSSIVPVIVIDPGHGGRDSGTIGPGGLEEKELALDVSRRLRDLLQSKLDAEVLLTRDKDVFVGLEDRTALANRVHADLFISIHGNGSDAPAQGIETYFPGTADSSHEVKVAALENRSAKAAEPAQVSENPDRKVIERQAKQLAQDVQRALHLAATQSGESRNRGVRKAPFVVLTSATMPAVLAEIAFVSSPDEERNLKRPEYRQQLAQGLFDGIAANLARSPRRDPSRAVLLPAVAVTDPQ